MNFEWRGGRQPDQQNDSISGDPEVSRQSLDDQIEDIENELSQDVAADRLSEIVTTLTNLTSDEALDTLSRDQYVRADELLEKAKKKLDTLQNTPAEPSTVEPDLTSEPVSSEPTPPQADAVEPMTILGLDDDFDDDVATDPIDDESTARARVESALEMPNGDVEGFIHKMDELKKIVDDPNFPPYQLDLINEAKAQIFLEYLRISRLGKTTPEQASAMFTAFDELVKAIAARVAAGTTPDNTQPAATPEPPKTEPPKAEPTKTEAAPGGKELVVIAEWKNDASGTSHPEEAQELKAYYQDLASKLAQADFDPRTPVNFIQGLKKRMDDFAEDITDAGGFVSNRYVNSLEVRRFLRDQYLAPSIDPAVETASDVLARLEERAKELDKAKQQKDFDQFVASNPKIQELVALIDSTPLPAPTDVAGLEAQIIELHNLSPHIKTLIADKDAVIAAHGNHTFTELEKIATKAEKRDAELKRLRVQHFVTNAATQPEFVAVADKIAAARAITTGNPIAVLTELRTAMADLENVTIPNIVDGSTVIPVTEAEAKAFEDLKKRILEPAKAEIDRLAKLEADATEVVRAKRRIEKAWELIMLSEKPTKGVTDNDQRINKSYTGDIDDAGILPLVERFFPEQLPLWHVMINLHNGFVTAAGNDVFKELGWNDTKKSREEVPKHTSFADMIAFVEATEKDPKTRGLKDKLEEIFSTGFYEYTVAYFTKGTYPGEPNFEGYKIVPDGTTGPRVKRIRHNYAMDGNPGEDKVAQGYKLIIDILKYHFPDADNSIIHVMQYVAVLGELRLKYHAKYHGNYLKSADPTFDTKPIFIHSPLHKITYGIRAYGKVLPPFRLLWQILRHPGRRDPAGNLTMYDESAFRDPEVTRVSYVDETALVAKTRELQAIENAEAAAEGRPPKQIEYSLEHLPHEADHNNKSADPNAAYRNDNVRKAVELRSLVDRLLTTSQLEFTPVQMDEEATLLPYMWDMAFADGRYGTMTYTVYNKSLEAWESFLKKAQAPRAIKKISEVNNAISEIVQALSPIKGLLTVVKAGTPDGERFRALIVQILLRYTKNIYDQYNVGARYTLVNGLFRTALNGFRPVTKTKYFLQLAISQYKTMGTLDAGLKHSIVDILEHHYTSVTDLVRDNLFSPALEDVTDTLSPAENNRRAHIIDELYDEELTEQEKKEGH